MAFVARFSGPEAGIGEVSEKLGVLSKFEFFTHASGANETLDSVGHQSNRRRHSFALSGGILLHGVAAIVTSFHHC
jgi:hypothetical protein